MTLVEELTGNKLASLASEVAAGRRDHILKALDEHGGAQKPRHAPTAEHREAASWLADESWQ